MNNPFKSRSVQLATAICLPLITVHFMNIIDLGYFVIVPVLALAVLVLAALTSAPAGAEGNDNG